MQVNSVDSKRNFGSNIVLEGPKRLVLKAFANITLSDSVWPKKVGDAWSFETLTLKKAFSRQKKMIATGFEDATELKKQKDSSYIFKTGYAPKDTFEKIAGSLPVLSVRKVLKAMKQNKFDYSTLTIKK